MPLLPVAVETSDPRLSGLKRAQGINLTVLEIRSPKIGVPGIKIKLSAGLHSLLETLRGNPLSCLLQLLETACIPCPMALPSIFNACMLAESFSCLISQTLIAASFIHSRTLVITMALSK